jgi:hypothetical protein
MSSRTQPRPIIANSCVLTVLLVVPTLASASAQNAQRVNRDSAIAADFQSRVAAYVKLHKQAQGGAPQPKKTSSPATITEYQHRLADAIRRLRPQAKRGDIFSPEAAGLFRKLISREMHGRDGAKLRKSFRDAEPVRGVRLEINQSYPDGLPLQSMPPSLLQVLPKLPPQLEYRFVGRELVLRDIQADLIVDTIPDAFPGAPSSPSKP